VEDATDSTLAGSSLSPLLPGSSVNGSSLSPPLPGSSVNGVVWDAEFPQSPEPHSTTSGNFEPATATGGWVEEPLCCSDTAPVVGLDNAADDLAADTITGCCDDDPCFSDESVTATLTPNTRRNVGEQNQGSYRSSLVKLPDFLSHGMTISRTLCKP